MPTYSKEKQKQHLELVRQAMGIAPRGGVFALQEILDKSGFKLHHVYILKLKDKIKAERKMRFNQAEVKERVAEIQDKAEQLEAAMWKILLAKSSTDKSKIAAATAIAKINKELFETQMDAGIFERKLGEFSVTHNHVISDDRRRLIVQAMENYGVFKSQEPLTITDASNPNTSTK